MTALTEFSVKGIEHYLIDVLGTDPVEHRPEKYIQALNGIGIEGIKKFIISMLEEGIPEEVTSNSYFHPNKFFKLGICKLSNHVKLRLHFWNKDQLKVQTPIHFHAWDFASLLITGSYTHDIFQIKDLDEPTVNHIHQHRIFKTPLDPAVVAEQEHYFGMYKIPKRDKTLGKFQPQLVKYVAVEKTKSRIEQQGSSYFLDMEFPHQITIDLKEVGAMITLVLTSETHPEKVFTFQPITREETFSNPAPNVDETTVRNQLKMILNEIDASSIHLIDKGIQFHESAH